MKPSISVIATARRFFASPETGTLEAEKGIPRFLLSFPFTFFTTLRQAVPFHPPPSLLSYAKRRDVDSLLGSNFYGDASSNISGKPRLLALVFDERTSRSILSGETSFSVSFLLLHRLSPISLSHRSLSALADFIRDQSLSSFTVDSLTRESLERDFRRG